MIMTSKQLAPVSRHPNFRKPPRVEHRPPSFYKQRNARVERLLNKGMSLVEVSKQPGINVTPRYLREMANERLWPHNAHVPVGSETERQIVIAHRKSGLSIHEIGLVFRQADVNIARILERTSQPVHA